MIAYTSKASPMLLEQQVKKEPWLSKLSEQSQVLLGYFSGNDILFAAIHSHPYLFPPAWWLLGSASFQNAQPVPRQVKYYTTNTNLSILATCNGRQKAGVAVAVVGSETETLPGLPVLTDSGQQLA